MNHRAVILAFALLFSACTVETKEEAQQKCRDLVSDWCKRMVGCFVDNGDLAASDEASEIDSCKKTGESTIDCGAAVSTSDNYDKCLDTVRATECSSVTVDAKLPAECKGVIEVTD